MARSTSDITISMGVLDHQHADAGLAHVPYEFDAALRFQLAGAQLNGLATRTALRRSPPRS